MLNRPFPYYDDWLFIFGKDRATCDLAEGPLDALSALDLEEETVGENYVTIEKESLNTDASCSMSAKVRGRKGLGHRMVLLMV